MGRFTINKALLPLKGQYFLWSAGTAPVVPFMPTYARQLGFTSVVVGIIYSILPVSGMLAKPFFGAIADRFNRQKTLFILFQLITALAFFNIQFLPEIPTTAYTELDCHEETFFKVCHEEGADICAAERLVNDAENIGNVHCQADCIITDESLWDDLCTSWNVPQYCPSLMKPSMLKFDAQIPLVHALLVEDCMFLRIEKVTFLDGKAHIPYCNNQTSTECHMSCNNKLVDELINHNQVNLDCGAEVNVKACGINEMSYKSVTKQVADTNTLQCQVECEKANPVLMDQVCSTWKAPCHPPNLEFGLVVPMNKTQQIGSCTYFRVHSTTFSDGTSHIPWCKNLSSNTCHMSCDNSAVNELIKKQATSDEQVTQLYQFWLFFALLVISWIGMAVVVSLGDAICFEMLGPNPSRYGEQRLWGAVGWGVFSIIAGLLVDQFSKGQTMKNYTIVFYLTLVILLLDMLVSSKLRYTPSKQSPSIVRDVGKLLGELRIVVFLLWCIFVGLCTGMVWNFLFWHLEDLASADGCDMHKWIKTLEGLVMGVQCFGGELPFFFLSGWILDKIGHIHAMSLVLLGFGVRFILYSVLANPWWCLPIELLQGVTFGIFYATMASYASIVAPPGTEATIQGLVGAIFEGIGVSLGSLLGGVLFNIYGGSVTYRMYGIASLCMFIIHVIVQHFMKQKRMKEFASSAHYAAPNDALNMIDDHQSLTHSQ